MRLVKRTVEKSIKETFGWDVKLHHGGGCYHFYSDVESDSILLAELFGTSVTVYRLNHLSLDQWLSIFESLFIGSELNVIRSQNEEPVPFNPDSTPIKLIF